MASSATFRIRRVKCVDEMGGSFRERFGNDEIKAAVFSADLRGSTKNSGRFDIYPDFDDGDVKTFDPPKEVVTLDLAGATGEVEVAFSVLLIESQLTEGDGLEKAWNEFVKIYEDAVKTELSKRQVSPERAFAVAQPGYLAPVTDRGGSGRRVSIPDEVLVGVGSVGTREAGTSTAASAANDTDLEDPNESEEDKKKKEEEKRSVGDAFVGALLLACALYAVKFVGSSIAALISWSQDKFFPPVAIKAKIDASTPPENVPANATGVAEFRGHDGLYQMEWDILVR